MVLKEVSWVNLRQTPLNNPKFNLLSFEMAVVETLKILDMEDCEVISLHKNTDGTWVLTWIE